MDHARIEAAAQLLIAQRAAGAVPLAALPPELRPEAEAETVAIQIETLRRIGPIGGWKVGAADASAPPVASPLPAAGIAPSPAVVRSRRRGVEGEIGFRFGKPLPPVDGPHDRDSVMAAIESCHATIEILEPRFIDQNALDPLTARADLGMHGGLVVGPAIGHWRPEMFPALSVTLTENGVPAHTATGSNPGGTDLIRLLVGLANSDVARAAGGIAAGAVVTTGSWTGALFASAGARVTVQFDGFPAVQVDFAD